MPESWRPSRRAFLLGTAAGAGGILVRSLLPNPFLGWGSQPAFADEPPGFGMSGLDGGGGIDCITIDPLGPRLLAGGDNSGPKVSTDGGASWRPDMAGLPPTGAALVGVAAEWDPLVPDRVWLATQKRSAADAGGLFASADAGATWTLASGTPKFDDLNGAGRPRAVGRLIRISADGAFVYLGSSGGALWRYEGFDAAGLGGTPTQILALTGAVITSIALDPVDPTRLFVSTRTGCWVVSGADLATTLGAVATPFSGVNAPSRTEEIVAVDQDGVTALYAACWTNGIRRFDASQTPDAAWDVVTPTTTSTNWCSLDAVREGSVTTLVAGNELPASIASGGFDPVSGNSSESLFMTTNASDLAPTWVSICSGVLGEGQLLNQSGGPGGPAWWGYLPTSQGGLSDNRLGAPGFVPEQIRISPSDPQKVYAAGTQGAFLFDRTLSTWYPAVRGLGTTANNTIVCDPNVAGRVIVTNIDHVCFVSVDGMVTVRKNENPVAGLPNNAYAAAFDRGTTPSRVYLGVGDTSNRKGAVVYQADPATFGNWVSLGKPAGSDKRPLGLAVRRIAGKVMVLAAVEAAGVFRHEFSTASPPAPIKGWIKASAAAVKAAQPTGAVPMRWEHDKMAYLFDHTTGIWASRNGGTSWQKIWTVKDRAPMEGYIAADPGDATGGTLFVSMGAGGTRPGVWKLTSCQTANATVENHKIHLTALSRPGSLPFVEAGPIVARAGGQVWVVENAEPNLYASADGGASWAPLGDDLFTGAAKRVSDMDVGADGAIYVSLRGPGVLVKPVS